MKHVASPKDRKYLESLNLKALQKSKPKGDQDPKEYYKALQDEAKSGPLFTDKVLDTVDRLPDLPKPVSKWLGNMDDKELKQVDAQDLRLIIDWVQGSEDADLEGVSWKDAMEAQKLWHDQLHDDKEDCGEYKTHKVVFSTGGYEFVDLTTDHDLQVEGCKLKHCVGGDNYCEYVRNKSSRIISLRDSKNEPQVTIEYRVPDKSVAQCYGYKNHPPGRKLNEPLVKFFEHMKWYDGILLLKNYTIPDDKWDVIVEHSGRRLRDIARHGGAPAHVLVRIVNTTDDTDILQSVGENPNTPAHVLDTLSDSNDTYIGMGVASNRNLSSAVIQKLLSKSDHNISSKVAKNPSTPAHILEVLAKSNSDWVRAGVAVNPAAPVYLLDTLAEDIDEYVRQFVACNTSASVHTLEKLSTDKNSTVRSQVADNDSVPVHILSKLTHDKSSIVRDVVSRLPRTPTADLTRLSEDRTWTVRRNVAANPSTPIETLRKIIHDEYEEDDIRDIALESLKKLRSKSACLRKSAHTLLSLPIYR